ncbi:MAG: hypothetical protein KAU28_00290 [Phycisphaerae bacterium]|nr:hypothetical protein [Phycisphaerae bacterium]
MLAITAAAILHGCSEETVATGPIDSQQDATIQYEQPEDGIPDFQQDETPVWPQGTPDAATPPELPEQTSNREETVDQSLPQELATDADGKQEGGDTAPADQDGRGGGSEDTGSDDTDGAQASTSFGEEDARGAAAAAPVDDRSDEQKLRDMLAMLQSGGPDETGGAGTSPSPPSDGPPSDGAVGPTEGQDAPPDNAAEADGVMGGKEMRTSPGDGSDAISADGGGRVPLPVLPTPHPLPPDEDVSLVEGTVLPEDVGSAQEPITGVWRQVGGSDAADFLPGGYVASEFAFLADGTIRMRRTFDADGDVVMTWRVSYEWNESQTELTVGLDPDTRPTPASLRGFTIRESNVQATSATQDLPCVLKCVRSDDGQILLADKTYVPAE